MPRIFRANVENNKVYIGFLDQRYDYSKRECYVLEDVNRPGNMLSVAKSDAVEITGLYYNLTRKS